MAMFLLFMIFILFFIGTSTGRVMNVLPLILLAVIGLFFTLGFSVIAWLIANPLILLVVVGIYLYNRKKAPKRKSGAKFYYHSNGAGSNNQDFEEFFKRASGSGFQYGEGGGYYNQSGTGFGNVRDRGEDYRTLGIQEGASKDEVKKAYRDAVKKHHPDRHVGASESDQAEHERLIKKINESYENIIKDF
ncbi:MAG: DnaJ domain-containing protein [Fusobacteriaceae bacterium]